MEHLISKYRQCYNAIRITSFIINLNDTYYLTFLFQAKHLFTYEEREQYCQTSQLKSPVITRL